MLNSKSEIWRLSFSILFLAFSDLISDLEDTEINVLALVALFCLTLSWRRPLSHRNQSIDLLCKLIDWFLYDNDPRHERVNWWLSQNFVPEIWKICYKLAFCNKQPWSLTHSFSMHPFSTPWKHKNIKVFRE